MNSFKFSIFKVFANFWHKHKYMRHELPFLASKFPLFWTLHSIVRWNLHLFFQRNLRLLFPLNFAFVFVQRKLCLFVKEICVCFSDEFCTCLVRLHMRLFLKTKWLWFYQRNLNLFFRWNWHLLFDEFSFACLVKEYLRTLVTFLSTFWIIWK